MQSTFLIKKTKKKKLNPQIYVNLNISFYSFFSNFIMISFEIN